jgi:hypothetical protein
MFPVKKKKLDVFLMKLDTPSCSSIVKYMSIFLFVATICHAVQKFDIYLFFFANIFGCCHTLLFIWFICLA